METSTVTYQGYGPLAKQMGLLVTLTTFTIQVQRYRNIVTQEAREMGGSGDGVEFDQYFFTKFILSTQTPAIKSENMSVFSPSELKN